MSRRPIRSRAIERNGGLTRISAATIEVEGRVVWSKAYAGRSQKAVLANARMAITGGSVRPRLNDPTQRIAIRVWSWELSHAPEAFVLEGVAGELFPE